MFDLTVLPSACRSGSINRHGDDLASPSWYRNSIRCKAVSVFGVRVFGRDVGLAVGDCVGETVGETVGDCVGISFPSKACVCPRYEITPRQKAVVMIFIVALLI